MSIWDTPLSELFKGRPESVSLKADRNLVKIGRNRDEKRTDLVGNCYCQYLDTGKTQFDFITDHKIAVSFLPLNDTDPKEVIFVIVEAIRANTSSDAAYSKEKYPYELMISVGFRKTPPEVPGEIVFVDESLNTNWGWHVNYTHFEGQARFVKVIGKSPEALAKHLKTKFAKHLYDTRNAIIGLEAALADCLLNFDHSNYLF